MKSIAILTISLILNCPSTLAQTSPSTPTQPTQIQNSAIPFNQNDPQINQVNFGNSQYPTFYGNGSGSQNPINLTGNIQVNPFTGTSYVLGIQWGFGGQGQTDQAREQLKNNCIQKLFQNLLTQEIKNACLEVGAPGFNQFKK